MTAKKPQRTKCPCCGASVPALRAENLPRLGANQQALVNICAQSRGARVTTDAIVERLWASDPEGGPLLPKKVVAVMVRQINTKTEPHGFKIECGGGRRDGYRIVYL